MQSNFNSGLNKLARSYPAFKDFIGSFKSTLPTLPYAYGLPKIHKPNCPLRPIISYVGSPAYNLSKRLASLLSPTLGSFSSSHLRHSGDLLSKLRSFNFLPHHHRFISFDAISLFTNIPLEPTLDFLSRKLPLLNLDLPISVDCFLELIRLCSKNSFFSFQGKYFEQIFGFSMGNPLSPVLANLFLEYVESELIPLYSGSKPIFYVRYVDDVLAIVDSNFSLDPFLNYMNSLFPTLKFTYEWDSPDSIPFLDVLILKRSSSPAFKVFRKTYSFQ